MYKMPIKPSTEAKPIGTVLGMAPKGVNKTIWGQFLDVNFAYNIENYIPSQEGYLRTRKGYTQIKDFSSSSPISSSIVFHDSVKACAYGTTLEMWDEETGNSTVVKSDFTSDTFELIKYGYVFFVTSKKNGLWRVNRQVTFNEKIRTGENSFILSGTGDITTGTITDTVTGATATVVTWESSERRLRVNGISGTFASGHAVSGGSLSSASITSINEIHVGKTITGSTSGATAKVVANTSGVLVLAGVNGTFQSGEDITDNYSTIASQGLGTLTSAVTYAINHVSDAPFASTGAIIKNRLYLGDLEEDETAVKYSSADIGTYPMFTNWTVGSGNNAAGQLSYSGGGKVNKILSQGNLAVILQEDGEFAFYIDTIESGAVYYKIDRTQDYRTGWGSSRAAIATDSGIFYANEAGLFQLAAVGQANVPFSQQETNLSWKSLGKKYFDNIDLSDADLMFDPMERSVMLSCAKNATENNFVIVCNIDTKAIYFFTGMQFKRMFYQNGEIYASDTSSAKLYRVFDGYSDNGADISRSYAQEVNFGSGMQMLSTLTKMEVQSLLSRSSEINFYLDIYDRNGVFRRNNVHYTMTPTDNGATGGAGFGGAGYGEGGFTQSELSNLINWIDQCSVFVRNAQRVILRIESTGSDVHSLSYVGFYGRTFTSVRKNEMTRQSS